MSWGGGRAGHRGTSGEAEPQKRGWDTQVPSPNSDGAGGEDGAPIKATRLSIFNFVIKPFHVACIAEGNFGDIQKKVTKMQREEDTDVLQGGWFNQCQTLRPQNGEWLSKTSPLSQVHPLNSASSAAWNRKAQNETEACFSDTE